MKSYILALALALLPASAFATTLPLITATTPNGTVPTEIANSWPGAGGSTISQINQTILGSLDKKTQVTFTYSMDAGSLALYSMTMKGTIAYSGTNASGYYTGNGTSDLTTNAPNLTGVSTYNSSGGFTPTAGGWQSMPLGLTVATVLDNQTAKITLTNLSDFTASFSAYLRTEIANLAANGFKITYQVSAVPLPAALPLFAMGLAGLAMARRRKRA